MGLKKDIEDKVKAILDENFDVEDVTYVPDISNSKLTFGNKGLQFEATVLFIDMRGSTKVLNSHNKTTVAKIHMSYFHTIIKIAKSHGGEVRSFNGDSMLVFFQGTTKISLSKAVKAAMQMRYMLSHSVNDLLKKYSEIDFGIGIDDGKILCTKIGVKGDSNNQDLIWIGNPVNKSTVLGDQANLPSAISISSYVYSNLTDEVKYHTKKDQWGNESKVDMWKLGYFTYNDESKSYYQTSYWWSVT